MNYAQIRKYDISNGPGVRTTLFVSGCTHNCPGCFNKEYMNFKAGKEFTNEVMVDFIWHYKNDDQVRGATILGGEPFQQTKDDTLEGLLITLQMLNKNKLNGSKPIWIFSGYTYEEIIKDPKKLVLLKWCDVLVDGKFDESLKNPMLRFRGSSNQRIIDIQKSLELKQVIELEEYYN